MSAPIKKVQRPSLRRKATTALRTFTSNDKAAIITVRLDSAGNITGTWFERGFTRESAQTYCDDYYESMSHSRSWKAHTKAPKTEEGNLEYVIGGTNGVTLHVVIAPTSTSHNELLGYATRVIYKKKAA